MQSELLDGRSLSLSPCVSLLLCISALQINMKILKKINHRKMEICVVIPVVTIMEDSKTFMKLLFRLLLTFKKFSLKSKNLF